jgi:hypothetical protein
VRELLEAIERVRERIERHGSKLSQNEMLTRYALVDPILRALGWDTEDPEQVVPEFQTEVGRPDYILHCADLRIGVEAKRLGADERTFEQAYLRALPLWQSREIRYYAITDGDRWILWDISKPRTQNPEPIVDIRLSRDNPGDAARQLLALWRPAMPEVKVGAPLVATGERENEERRKPETRDETQLEQSLQRLKEQVRPGQSPPTSIRFPDGTQEDLRTWKDLLVAVAKWALPKLKQKGKLPLDNLIQDQDRLIQNGRQMLRPQDIGYGWLMETNFSSKDCVRNAVRILEAAGVSADQVFVTLGEGQGRRGRLPKGKG